MTYELAKQLKEAGFPQTNTLFVYVQRTKTHKIEKFGEWGLNLSEAFLKSDAAKIQSWVVSPTLEELIEACGDKFAGLLKCVDIWFCATPSHTNRPSV